MKKILVLMSVYNGAQYLTEQIESIIEQIGVDVYLLIRDDGSSDQSLDIIKQFEIKFPKKIKYIKGGNKGFAESFSELLQNAYSTSDLFDYYAFSDQDDVWLNDKLIVAITQLSDIDDPTIPCAYCSNTILVDNNLDKIKEMRSGFVIQTKEKALVQNLATGCTMVFNTKAVELYVNYRPDFIKVHDYLMYLICIFIGRVVYDEAPHMLYRQHANNQIGRKSFLARIRCRLKSQGKSNGYYYKQSLDFLEAYKQFLSIDDVLIISYLCNYKRNLLTRLLFAFSKKYRYDSFEFNFFRFIKVMRGCL